MKNKKFTDADGIVYTTDSTECCSFSASVDTNQDKPQAEELDSSPLFIHSSPSGEYQEPIYEDRATNRRSARKIISSTHLLIFIFILTSQFLSTFFMLACGMVMPEELYLKISNDSTFLLIMSSVFQYYVAFPLLLVLNNYIKRESVTVKEKSKMPILELLWLLLISYGLMLIGSIIGAFSSELIGNLFSVKTENTLETLVMDVPTPIVFLFAVVIAPIIEEIIYRKIMIDRLSPLGDGTAILLSSLAFGFMHGNLYQLFYAIIVGFILGYVYTRTRRLGYTVAMHATLNFVGSIVAIPISEASSWIIEAEKIIAEGGTVNETIYLFLTVIVFVYSILQYLIMAAAVVALILYIILGFVKISKQKELVIKGSDTARASILNFGVLLFYATCLILMLIAILSETVT